MGGPVGGQDPPGVGGPVPRPPGPPGGVTGPGGGTGPQVLGSTPGALEIPAEALGSGGPQRAPISCWPWIWEPLGALRGHKAKRPRTPRHLGTFRGPSGGPGSFFLTPPPRGLWGLKGPLGAPRDPSPGGLGCRGACGAIFLTTQEGPQGS